MVWPLLTLLLAMAGCSEPEPARQEELRPEPSAESPSLEGAATTAGPMDPRPPEQAPLPPTSATDPVPTAAEPLAPLPTASRWLGRWEASTRDGVCIELRPNGAFELTSRSRARGDVVVTGRYTLQDDGEAAEVTLRTGRVHQERYVSACRRHVFPERDLPGFRILGVDFRRGLETVLSLRQREDGTPELCASERCQPLRPRA